MVLCNRKSLRATHLKTRYKMDRINKQLKTAIPGGLPDPNSVDYEVRMMRLNHAISERRVQRAFQIQEAEKRISHMRAEKNERRSKILAKILSKTQIDKVNFEFNKPDPMYIQLLEQLYALKNDEGYTEKTEEELLTEKQSLLEKLVLSPPEDV